MEELKVVDIVISIYNQEKIIERVLYGIFTNTTTPFNLILVFDGCTDRTKERSLKYVSRYKPSILLKTIIEYSDNVFETRANNIGFKRSNSNYLITLQDDMVIDEYGWEKRLTYPLRKFNYVFAVSSRTAQDINCIELTDKDSEYFINQRSRELNNLPRNVFAVRDVINRGPIAFNNKHLKSLNYLNDDYAPSDLDDADLCLRAWSEKGLVCGAFWINYISKLEWGKTRAKDSTMHNTFSLTTKMTKLNKDHYNYIKSNIKHSKEIIISDFDIDYNTKKRNIIKNVLIYPIRCNILDILNLLFKCTRNLMYATLNNIGLKDVYSRGIKKTLLSLFK